MSSIADRADEVDVINWRINCRGGWTGDSQCRSYCFAKDLKCFGVLIKGLVFSNDGDRISSLLSEIVLI